MSKNLILQALKDKFEETPLLVFLSVIGIVGLISNSTFIYTGKSFYTLFSYPSILLGLGLLFESHIRQVLNMEKSPKDAIAKLITFTVGFFILIGGLLTLPIFGMEVPPTLKTILGFANLIALVVVVY